MIYVLLLSNVQHFKKIAKYEQDSSHMLMSAMVEKLNEIIIKSYVLLWHSHSEKSGMNIILV